MALWPARVRSSQLALRLLSALVIAPPVLAAVYFGRPYMQGLAILIFGLAIWEWIGLCAGSQPARRVDAAGWLAVGTVALALALDGGATGPGAWIVAGGAVATAALRLMTGGANAAFYAAGVLYIGLASLGLLWLRDEPGDGRALVFWLLFLVWITDTCAYFVGRTLGGPKLAPKISPNKTWSGFIGGLLGGALVGLVAGLLWPSWEPLEMAAASAGLALLAQAGDLLESRLKRQFGVKDSGRLIPGHGGMLDRLDSVLAASLAVGLAYWLNIV